MDFSYVPKGSGSWFGESSVRMETKAALDRVVGLVKLKEVGVGDIGYCNLCWMIGGGIGSFCKGAKRNWFELGGFFCWILGDLRRAL